MSTSEQTHEQMAYRIVSQDDVDDGSPRLTPVVDLCAMCKKQFENRWSAGRVEESHPQRRVPIAVFRVILCTMSEQLWR